MYEVQIRWSFDLNNHTDGLVQHLSNSIAYALELLQSCAKPLIYQVKTYRSATYYIWLHISLNCFYWWLRENAQLDVNWKVLRNFLDVTQLPTAFQLW